MRAGGLIPKDLAYAHDRVVTLSPRTPPLLGANVLVAKAGEIIKEATLAIRCGNRVHDLVETLHPFWRRERGAETCRHHLHKGSQAALALRGVADGMRDQGPNECKNPLKTLNAPGFSVRESVYCAATPLRSNWTGGRGFA